MAAYYNEIDPFAAQWLRELMKQNLIAPGDVDERSIEDVIPAELSGYTQCHFFAGIGVWSYALRSAGWPDDRPVWTGSCPCQPFSSAGKGGGFADERHLWPAFHWLIQQCRPSVVFGEQVAKNSGAKAWIKLVSSDLLAIRRRFASVRFEARSVAENHPRPRSYWVSDTNNNGESICPLHEKASELQDTTGYFRGTRSAPRRDISLAHGPSYGVVLCRGYGNAIVAQQAQAFIEAVMCLVDGVRAVEGGA